MRILVIAPHADDETIGMGGTISFLSELGHDIVVAILTGHGLLKHPIWPKSNWDIVREEAKEACKILGVSKLIFRDLPAACLDNINVWEINDEVRKLIKEENPDEIYLPFAHDLHKDHQAITYAATVATRPYLDDSSNIKRISAYETLSETNLNFSNITPVFQPNVFINISKYFDKKIKALNAYKSQIQKNYQPRSSNGVEALAKLRGMNIGCKYAESFYLLGEYKR